MTTLRASSARTLPDVRDRILAAATQLFAARGFDGTALSDVAAAVGIRKPSLLYHFSSKDELRRAVLEKLLGHWNDVLPRILQAATSGEGRFDAVMQEMLGFFTADPDRARIIVREILDRPVEMGELVAVHTPPWISLVCNYIRRGQVEGRIYAEVDPEAYVVQVINLVVSGIATWDCVGAIGRFGAQARPDGKPQGKHSDRGARLPARHLAEMLRVAKASLFVPLAATGSAARIVDSPKAAPRPERLPNDRAGRARSDNQIHSSARSKTRSQAAKPKPRSPSERTAKARKAR